MKQIRSIADRRASSIIEFAIIVPVLLLLLGGVVDFALSFWFKDVLGTSVEQGAEYAFLVGPGVSTSAVQTVVGRKLSLPASAVTVTGPSCYCINGAPASASSQSCTQTCPSGVAPGTYMTITATYTYNAVLPAYSKLSNPQLSETVMVRLR